MSIMNLRNLAAQHGMPRDLDERFQRLLTAPGNGCNYSVCRLTGQLHRLSAISSEWVREHLIPCFSIKHPACEGAWSGLFYSDQLPTLQQFCDLKRDLLDLYPIFYDWNWGETGEQRAHHWLTDVCTKEGYVSPGEAITVIRNLSCNGRSDVVDRLREIGQSNENWWSERVIPFLTHSWPRERSYQVESLSLSLVTMMVAARVCFRELFLVIKYLIGPFRVNHRLLRRFHVGLDIGDDSLAKRYHERRLDLMDRIIPSDGCDVSYDLRAILRAVAAGAPDLFQNSRFIRLQSLCDEGPE